MFNLFNDRLVLTFDILVITLSRVNNDFVGENVLSFRKWRSAIKYFQVYENQSDIWTVFWRQIHDQVFISWLKRSQCNTLFKCQYVGTSFTWTSVLFSSGSANLKKFHKYIILLWHPGSWKYPEVPRTSCPFHQKFNKPSCLIIFSGPLKSHSRTSISQSISTKIKRNCFQ